jgi:hypothetical protein
VACDVDADIGVAVGKAPRIGRVGVGLGKRRLRGFDEFRRRREGPAAAFSAFRVVKVAEELVEPVHGRQVFVAIAEMVLAELPGGVAERLQELRDRRIAVLQPDGAAGIPTLESPVRRFACPVMNVDLPAVQLCSA